jgi:phosphoglycerate dehydrogenase-like enzyme
MRPTHTLTAMLRAEEVPSVTSTPRSVVCQPVLALVLGACLATWASPAVAQPDASQIDRLIAELGLREAPTPLSASPQWRKPARVLVRDLTPERKAWLQDVAPGVELVNADSMSEARTAAVAADAVLGFCEEEILAASPNVRWVQTYNAGVERCLTSDVFQQRGIVLTNMQRIAGPVMAEHVMALVLAHSRGLPGYLASQRDGRWSRGDASNWTPFNASSDGNQPAFSLSGKTMLIVGYGGIGTEVARRAQAFGMRIIGIRNTKADLPPGVARMGLPADLAAFVKEADIVVNTLPLTPDTRGMFDATIFGAMKRTTFFVNVGRGGTVVTEALLKALQDGTIGGAGLDVVDPEPVPDGHPLWKTPRLILTPHVAADSDLDEDVRWLLIRENLRRFVAGGRMLSVVDTARGY